jgi:serine/threonine protein kinase
MEIYIENNNNVYIPIYEIGHGRSAILYYCIEIENYAANLKLKKIKITSKVLKFFNDDSMSEFEKEINTTNLLCQNGVKFDNINYFVSYIKFKKIIIYEACFGSLFELCELFDYKFEENIKNSIKTQMIDCIKNMHKCEYLHNDIKLENFLVRGENLKQYEILKKINENMHLFYNLKIHKNLKNTQIVEMSYSTFKIIQNLFRDKNDEDNKSNKSDESDYENNNYSSKSSFCSNRGDFYVQYDPFHINEIFNNDKMSISNESYINDENQKIYFEKFLKDIKILISDFGLISYQTIDRTCQYINFRHADNILGNITSYENDEWALKMTIYEFENKDLFYNIKHHDYYKICENNLIVLYYLKTNIHCNGIFKNIYFNNYCLKYI